MANEVRGRLPCPNCSRKTYKLLDTFGDETPVRRVYKCNNCGKYFKQLGLTAPVLTTYAAEYPIKECPVCKKRVGGKDYEEHVDSHYKKKCPKCGEMIKNKGFGNHVASHGKGEKMDTDDFDISEESPYTGKVPYPPNKVSFWDKVGSIRNGIAERVKSKYITIIILVILGAIAIFYGWNLLGIALIFSFIYTILPDKYDVISDATVAFQKYEDGKRKEQPEDKRAKFVLDEGTRSDYINSQIYNRVGSIFAKSLFKVLILFFFTFEFTARGSDQLIFINGAVISLAALFIAYFSMPTVYKENEYWDAIEGWARFLVGITISIYLWAIFSNQAQIALVYPNILGWLQVFTDAANGVPGAALFFVGLAFFATIPSKVVESG